MNIPHHHTLQYYNPLQYITNIHAGVLLMVLGICTTTDLDYYWHMNNARYLRNADINRLEFAIRTGMLNVIRERGARILLGASTIRYRRALEAFEMYSLHCRVSKLIGINSAHSDIEP